MSDSPQSIADVESVRARRLVLGVALLAGLAAAAYYAALGLTLSHYDARGHLIVARRLIDSLTPGWRQIGGVWLPLPHLLNALPVQWDWSYRTGWSGTLISVACMAFGLRALSAYLSRATGSQAIAVAVPLMILFNPNVLYLQSTPMTEAILFGLALVSVASVSRWLELNDPAQHVRTGLCLAALTLTRYEGWFITAALLGFAALASWRRAWRLAWYPIGAALAFLYMSWASTGSWLVTSGFFEANNPALGNPALALDQMIEGAGRLGGRWLLWLGLAGGVASIVHAGRVMLSPDGLRRDAARALVPLSLAAAAALPLFAFTNGHPVRIRYMTTLVVAAAVCGAFLLARLPRRLQAAGALVSLAVALWTTPPLDPGAPMVMEAQWERPFSDARRSVTAALMAQWDGTPIMASMGSLGHYMQQMAEQGFAIKDFLHEGNGDIWTSALIAPRPFVRWILIEETAEGGDVLAKTARANPSFLEGFARAATGGGVVLYVRSGSGSPK